MKLFELYQPKEQLDEINAKKALAAGGLALAAYTGYPEVKSFIDKLRAPVATQQAPKQAPKADPAQEEIKKLTDLVVKRFKVKPELAEKIVTLAKKHEKPVFPKAEDLLSIIAIESSFNPNAVSNLKKDPAVGLTQIRPKVWGYDPKALKNNIETQIKGAADILDKYNRHLKDEEDAVHAYNIGLGSFRKGKFNQKYVDKFNRERNIFASN